MRRIGLMPSNTGKPGGDQTGYQMMEYVIEGGRFESVCNELISNDFKLNWGDNVLLSSSAPQADGDENQETELNTNSTAKKDRIKFSCPGCSLNAWAKPSAQLACATCSLILAPNPLKGRNHEPNTSDLPGSTARA
jgi:hypothetical protein